MIHFNLLKATCVVLCCVVLYCAALRCTVLYVENESRSRYPAFNVIFAEERGRKRRAVFYPALIAAHVIICRS